MMIIFSYLLYIVLLLWPFCCQLSHSQSIRYKIEEETSKDSSIGNIAHLHSSLTSVKYIIRSPFLRVTANGEVLLAQKIDLEQMCGNYQKCCGVTVCSVQATVLAKDSGNDRSVSITIHLEITDKNDNIPRFAKPTQIIQVPENIPVGNYLFLEQAYDADFSQNNKITHYNLVEKTDTFQLDQSRKPSIGLIIKKPIDYEIKNKYFATLEACDSGVQCSTQKLEIEVIDKNDNFPVFNPVNYKQEILENFPVGQQILQVKAMDKDSNKFNQILYGFHQSMDSNLKETLIITENTGSIKLQKALSAKIRNRYEFKVFAVDKYAISSHKSIANILITVRDLNDHSPLITLMSDNQQLEIPENHLPKEIVALEVTDEDIGINANVSCNLEPQSLNDFKLTSNGLNIYSLTSVRRFNYETERQVKAVIACQDGGIPRNAVRKPLTIHIIDVNEYSPECEKEYYSIKVKENRPPDEHILTIKGIDRDGSSKIHFSLFREGTLYFKIDQYSGKITSTERSLDKESMDNIEINVKLKDGNHIDSKTGECRVSITITDENDNAPRFTIDDKIKFKILENKPIYSRVDGALTAMDSDKDEQNSKVMFELSSLYDHNLARVNENIFKVKEDGNIVTLQSLDRERSENYTLNVKAYDTGIPAKSTKMNITIVVLDVNDNPPKWINPKPYRGKVHTLNISAALEPRVVVMKLDAYDADVGENNRITYSIMNNNRQLFKLNDTTGELSVARILPVGSVHLFLRATDNGYPPRYTETNMVIHISGSEVATLNMTIILILIGVTGIIAVFLIVAIVCVQRKPRYASHTQMSGSQQSFEAAKVCNDNFNHCSWIPNMDECRSTSGQLFADNASVCYIPSEVDPSLPMHAFIQKDNISPPLMNYPNTEMSMFATLGSQSGNNNRLYNVHTISHTNLSGSVGPVGSGGGCCDMTSHTNYNIAAAAAAAAGGIIGPGNPNMSLINRFGESVVDDDSADSGKGASEDDPGLQHHQLPLLSQAGYSNGATTFDSACNLNKNRLYTTMPYQSRLNSNNRIPVRQQRSGSTLTPNLTNCPFYILPEDSVIPSSDSTNLNAIINNDNSGNLTAPMTTGIEEDYLNPSVAVLNNQPMTTNDVALTNSATNAQSSSLVNTTVSTFIQSN